MGSLDLDAVFDCLDPSAQGFISANKLREFHEVLHFTPISNHQVEAALSQVCGENCIINRQNFLGVLQELDRRRTIEERAIWDFRALDNNADGRIPLKDALLLLCDTHGDAFTMSTWDHFMARRESSSDEVCFDELRMLLCNLPITEEAETSVIADKERELEEQRKHNAWKEYDSAKHWQENAASEEKEKRDYRDSLLSQAQRKYNKWEREGLESLLFDDGKEADGKIMSKSREKISLKDLYAVLEEKYVLLRQKLTWDMVLSNSDELEFTGASDNIAEVYRSAENLVKELWRIRKLDEKWEELPGSINHSESSLLQLMGELANENARHKAETAARYDSLIEEGKSPAQARQALSLEYLESMKGMQTYGGLLCDLLSRYQSEKEALAVTIKSWLPQKDATHQISRHYFRLRVQGLMIGEENRFLGTGYACGLGERTQVYKSKSYDWDRVRAEKLAFIKLAEAKGRQPRKHVALPESGNIKKSDLGIQEEIIHQLIENFAVEREMLMSFLQGIESSKSKSTARILTNEKRRGRMNALRSQRQAIKDQMATETSESLQKQHNNILQEATGLCYEAMLEETMKTAPNITEDGVNSLILADLVQKQYTVMDSLLYEFVSLESKDLKRLLKDLRQAYSNEFLDNVAFVLLGTLDLTVEERRYVDALDLKYKVIRETILLHALKKHHGSAWKRMVKADRQRELREKKKEEKRQRAEGRFADMATLLGTISKDILPLRTLVGEDKGEYTARVTEDEIDSDKLLSQNPLADLVVRQEAEQTYLLTWLRSPEVKSMSHACRQAWLIRLLLERLCVEQEGDYDIMGYRLGLVERVDAALTHRHAADCRRQEKLAELRCKARRHRLVQKKIFQKEPVPEEKPESGDIVGWQVAYLNQVIQRHLEEGEQLLQLCQDDTLGELQEAAETMDNSDKQKRLSELWNKRRQLDLENSGQREESLSILEEAAAIKTLCRKATLEKQARGGPGMGKPAVTVDDVAASLVSDLCTEQDRELATILQHIVTKKEAELQKLFSNEVNARRWEMVENVVIVLTRFEGDTTDDKLLQELDEKYDSLRDKLLAEALMRQIGEAEWQRLSEQERQRRLAMLKLQERKLRKEGKFVELSRLLGDQKLTDKNLRDLLGASRAESDRRLQERLANRRRRQANGENVSDDESDADDNAQSETGNVLGDLNRRYEEERDALMARLQGRDAQYLGEKERQAELLRLRRERRQAEREGRFEQAAIALGLVERHAELQDKLKSDRERQDQLLRARLDAIRQGKTKSGEKPPMVVKLGDRVDLQDAVLRLLEHRHGYEEERLVSMLSDKLADLQSEVIVMSELEREDRLAVIKAKIQDVPQGRSKERQDLLHHGVTVKSLSRASTLLQAVNGAEVSDDDVCVSLMADLRAVQNEEAEKMINDVTYMNEAELIALQEEILASEKNNQLDCVVTIVFRPEGQSNASEGELLSALDGKYDALKDKLFVEALMKQAGETNWLNLSEKERQRRLFELKLKERKLRQENKLDELGKLLGEDLQNREALSKILADTEEEQRRKAKEKLEKRRQRLAQGLSEEKCDELEKEEEEEELNKPRNVLLELQHRYEQEKAELLRQLKDSSGKLSAEKERQQELMRLKLQQRRVRHEDRFDSAALVLGLARENQQKVERNIELERERQMILARERMEARKNKKKPVEEVGVELSSLGDTNSEMSLQGALTNEITARHQAERDYLMQLFEACNKDSIQSLSESDVSEKFSKLQREYTTLRQSSNMNQKALHEVFQAALVVQLRRKQTQLEVQGGDSSVGGLQVALLADLQQIQDEEFTNLMSVMVNKTQDLESLKHMKAVQSQKRKESSPDNLAAVLLDQSLKPSQTDSSDKAILKALSDKYDALKERLFAEAARQKKGDNWWDSASEEERQAEIDTIRQEDTTLRDQGRGKEADSILEGLLGTTDWLGGHSGVSDGESTAQGEKLREERLEAGMSLDEVLQLEEAEKGSLLDRLAHDYEAERAALLAMLKSQQDQLAEEKSRQLALAKLKRDERRLRQEENIDGAMLLFEMANTQRNKLQQNLDSERSRQRALAEDRLAARRGGQRHLVEGDAQAMEDKLKQQQLTDTNNDGVSITSILGSLELKHEEEREMLFQLYSAVNEDTSLLDNARSKSGQDILAEQKSLKQQRDDWLTQMQQSHADQSGDSNDAEYLHQVATARSQQFPLLKTALILKLEVLRRLDGNSESNDLEKVKVTLLIDLQTQQNMETEKVQTALLSQLDESVLGRAERSQRRACREGWYLTLAEALLLTGDGDQDRLYQQDREATVNSSVAQGLSEAETEALLKQLDQQHKALLQRTKSERELHEKEVKRKLLERKQSQQFKTETEDEALNILLMSGAQAKQAEDATVSEKNRQNALMQERLAARRAARKATNEEKRSDDGSRPSSQESKVSSGSRTPIRVSLDSADTEKQASQLISQQTYYNRKISEEQARQAEKLRRRLEQNPSRRKEEAVAVLSLGERQKSVLEKSKQEEYARQKTSVQERVAQVRYEKTMTMRERSRSPASRSQFGQISEEEENQATEDKMKQTAQNIESKLKQEENNQADEPSDELLTEKSRLDKLKQRRAEKKQKRLRFADMPE